MINLPKLATIRDCMDTEVHTLKADEPITNAVITLIGKKVTGAPVVDDDNRVVGMITEKDCLNLLALGDSHSERATGTVGEYMSTDLVTVRPDMNIYFVAGMFLNDNVRRYPVVENGVLVGAVTRYDIVRAIHHTLIATPAPAPPRD